MYFRPENPGGWGTGISRFDRETRRPMTVLFCRYISGDRLLRTGLTLRRFDSDSVQRRAWRRFPAMAGPDPGSPLGTMVVAQAVDVGADGGACTDHTVVVDSPGYRERGAVVDDDAREPACGVVIHERVPVAA